MARPSKYSPELRRRAVIEVIERNRSIVEVALGLGIGSPETLRSWVGWARRDAGLGVGPTTEELIEIRRLRREVADQQRTIEILKTVTTFLAQEIDPDIGDCGVHRREPSPLASCYALSEHTYYAARMRRPCTRAMSDQAFKVEIGRVWESIF